MELAELARNGEIEYVGNYDIIRKEDVIADDEDEPVRVEMSDAEERKKELLSIVKNNASYFLMQKYDKPIVEMSADELSRVVEEFQKE